MKLYSYVVRRDFGFAPNPFHGVNTLATCKPDIRKHAQVGDWVVGTGGANSPKGPDLRGRLVYAMKVEEILTFDQYWVDERFVAKRPNLRGSAKLRMGDNIYHTTQDGSWFQADSHHRKDDGTPNEKNIERDTLTTTNVLISNHFVYFGGKAITIPNEFNITKKGPGHRCDFDNTLINDFVKWIEGIGLSGKTSPPLEFPL